MSNSTAVTQTTNIVPVQGIFEPEPTFGLITFIGPAGTPFLPPTSSNLNGVTITNSTINSSVIGGTVPAAGNFTNIYATTGQVATSPTANTDIANKAYVDSVAQGLDVKTSCVYATTGNITLSGLAVQTNGDWTSTLTAGDRILVKSQTNQAQNGIYVASGSSWSRSSDMDVWSEVPGAFTFIEDGATLASTGWVTTAARVGTIGVTNMPWSQFSGVGTYTAGTGLTLTGNSFSITNTTVSATSYGSGSQVATFTVNAQGQLTAASNVNIAIAATQITSGTIDSARLSGSYGGITGLGTLANLTVTNPISGSITGNAGTATKATNLANGATGSVPYQNAADTTTFLAPGSNGQVLTLAAGVPSWATPTTGTVTSVSQTFTGGIISVGGSPITGSGTLALTIAGTSGGIPYFSSATTWASSAVLAANALMVGGGAGAAPSTITTGTGVVTALGVNTGSAGAFVVNGGALGTPSSGVVTNLTGTAAINITGTATNLAGGAAASIPYQSAAGTTAFLASGAGDSGKVLQSNGTSAPSWVTPVAYATVTDDTTTNATRYPLFANQTTGNLTTNYVASTKYQFNPSTGLLTATGFSGSGANLTSLPAGQLSGTIPSGVLGNSTVYIGTTAIALNRSSASQSLTGVNIDGSAGSATTATTATNATNVATTDNTSSTATWYPTILANSSGNNPVTVSSTKLSFVPSTGTLSATVFSGAGTSLTGTASSLSIGGNAATATSAGKWTTARTLAGNSVDGSANVAFSNKFIVQGTTDAGLSGAQFLGALGTGIVKNTTTTGVLSIAVAADFPTLNQNTTGTAANVTGIVAVANGGTAASDAATARTNLGATTVGGNFFTLTNPSAITFPRINADNTVSALDAATFRTAIGAGTGSGTVTSVTGTSPVASSGGTTPAISLAASYGDTQNPYASKTANYFLAAPNGAAGVPTFRAVVAADIPTLNQNTTGTAANATNIAITDDVATAAEMYPTWVTANTGNLPAKVSSTKLKFNPSTGVLTVTGGTGGGNF